MPSQQNARLPLRALRRSVERRVAGLPAFVAAVLLASCSGGHAGSMMPAVSSGAASSASRSAASTALTASAPDPYTAAVLGDGVLAYYRMNDTSNSTMAALSSLNPAPANLTGVYGENVQLGFTPITTQGGTAAFFHGSQQYTTIPNANVASVPANAAFATARGALTVEAWIKPNSLQTDYYLPVVSYGRQVAGQAWVVQITAQSHLNFTLKTGGGAAHLPVATFSVTGSTVLSAGTVYYVAASYDGTTAKIYLNGILDGSLAVSGPIDYDNIVPAFGLGIGGALGPNGSGAQWSYSGPMSDVGIYASALDPGKVATHYHLGTTVPPSGPYVSDVIGDHPLAYYRLDDATPNLLYSDVPNAYFNGAYGPKVVLQNASLTSEFSDTSALFPGAGSTESMATVPANRAFETSYYGFTVEAWIRPTSLHTTWYIPIVSYGRQVQGQAWVLQINEQSHLNFWLKTGEGPTAIPSSGHIFSGATQLQAGSIYQVAATYDGTTAKIYVDGKLDGSLPVTGPIDYNWIYRPEWGLAIGGTLGNNPEGINSSFAGAIDDVSIYDSALDAARIAVHYRDGSQSTPVATGPKIYVSESTANTILTFNPDGTAGTPTITRTSTNGLNGPGAIALDSFGKIYVLDAGSPQSMTTYNQDGTRAPETFTQNVGAPYIGTITIDSANRIYLGWFDEGSYAGTVQTYVTDGVATNIIAPPYAMTLANNGPQGVAVSPSGAIYVAWGAYIGDCTVVAYSAYGTNPQTIIDFPYPACPQSIALDPAGKLHIANQAANSVATYNADGTPSSPTITAGIDEPNVVAVDANGKIYVANGGNRTITTYNADGSQTTPIISLPGNSGFSMAIH